MAGETITRYTIRKSDGGYYVDDRNTARGWFRTRERAVAASRQMAWGETVRDDTPEPYPHLD